MGGWWHVSAQYENINHKWLCYLYQTMIRSNKNATNGICLTPKLTLYILNGFKDYKRSVRISYNILDCIQQKKPKFTMEQHYMLPILYCQYHACWCPGDLSHQGISRHGIDQIRWNIPSLASEELKSQHYLQEVLLWSQLTKYSTHVISLIIKLE